MSSSKKPSLNQDTKELEQKIEELTQALKIERADSINMRRRHEEAINSLRTRVKANVIRELLPAIDNLERALKHVPKDLENSPYVKGVESVVKQFDKSLASIGAEKIKTVGQKFDPTYHEAVSMEEGSGNEEIVSEELQTGYLVDGEVIRHAVVKVKLK